MTTKPTPCSRQNVASSAWPSGVLATCRHGPWRPMRASSVAAPTSTPQMMSVTVTCLVHATGCRATVRSCVTRRPPVPKLSHGCGLRGDGRQRPRARVGGHRPSRSPHLTIPKGRPPDTRGATRQNSVLPVVPVAFSAEPGLPSPDPRSREAHPPPQRGEGGALGVGLGSRSAALSDHRSPCGRGGRAAPARLSPASPPAPRRGSSRGCDRAPGRAGRTARRSRRG
ncbi:hypothetical protein SAMN02799642_04368 [Methylobacterium brachiatum]|nr:hypothetical protein SAMN02799642_04368 [Methylobacterium brachiatum]